MSEKMIVPEDKRVDINQDIYESMHEEDEKLEVELTDYKSLTKDELISVIESKTRSLEQFHGMEEEHEAEIKRLGDYYVARIKELHSIIAYHERKLNILKSIITLEEDAGNQEVKNNA